MRANECFEASNYSIITFSCSPARLAFQRKEGGQARLRDFHLISLNSHCNMLAGLELEKIAWDCTRKTLFFKTVSSYVQHQTVLCCYAELCKRIAYLFSLQAQRGWCPSWSRGSKNREGSLHILSWHKQTKQQSLTLMFHIFGKLRFSTCMLCTLEGNQKPTQTQQSHCKTPEWFI